jgi:hypothetical protein
MSEQEPLIRGNVILAYRAFLEKEFGVGGFHEILSAMPKEQADKVPAIPLAHEWYPTSALVAMVETAFDLHPSEDLHDRLGAWNAEYDLNFVHRFLLRFTSPLWILQKGAKLWSQYHNNGHWIIEAGPGPRELSGSLHDFALVRPTFCKTMIGWLRRAGQLTGAKTMSIDHPHCRVHGAPACVFHGKW